MDKAGALESYLKPTTESYPANQSRRARQKWWQLGGKDISHVSVDDGLESSPESSSGDLNTASRDNVFTAAEAVELYKPIEGFEGTHRFEPTAVWTVEEEKRLVRKVCPLIAQCQ